MNNRRLKEYILEASIHTVSVRSNYSEALQAMDNKIVKTHTKLDSETGELRSHSIINPHYYNNEEIMSYSLYENTMSAIMKEAGVSDYEYDRIDIRLDRYEDDYLEYFKLNSLLINLFAMEYRFKNNEPTESAGHRTRKKCSIFARNRTMGIEYYDKNKESEGKYPCKARLEFRAMRLEGKTPLEVVTLWFKRLDRVVRHYEKVQDSCNAELLKYYKDWVKSNCPKRKRNDMLLAFVRENKDCFYTAKQLENFCVMCGVRNPKSRAKNLKQSCNIEFFSQKDINTYISNIKGFIRLYMNK